MKKFSKITGAKIGQEPTPKGVKSVNEEEVFRTKVYNLLDELLKVTTYGPIGRYQSAGAIKIGGKELFVEALMDLLTTDKLREEVKLLESLKSDISNWEAIDSKIDEKLAQIEELTNKDKFAPHRERLKFIFEKYSDEELVMEMIDLSCKKIDSLEVAKVRAEAANQLIKEGMPKELFSKIAGKYLTRAEELTK